MGGGVKEGRIKYLCVFFLLGNMDTQYSVSAEFDVTMRARDETELAVDVYRPADPDTHRPIEEPKPALLSRTPYGKRGEQERHGEWFAKRGYVVAIQDCRGRYGSEGEYEMFVNEAEDGYDAVEWLADQPYCDGQVGTIGSATMQSSIATQNPPHIEAMFVNQGAANGQKATFRHHGAFELRWLCWTFTVGAPFSKRALRDPSIQRAFASVDVRDLLADGPVFPGETPLRHVPEYEQWLFDMMNDGRADSERWSSPGIDFESYYGETADCPTVFAGGWYDSYTRGTVDNFVGLRHRKESDYFLIVGPWTHGWDRYPHSAWNKPYSGEIAFGDGATRDYQETRRKFFDHYLKDQNTWADQPAVEYMKMGTGDGHKTGSGRLFHGGTWETATEWPLPDAEPTAYYAHGDGALTRDVPDGTQSSTTYEFDPEDPVPTVGGNCSSYQTYEQSDRSLLEYPLSSRKTIEFVPGGGYDQRTSEETFGATPPYGPLERRNDVLVFRTESLDEPLEIAGPIRVTIYASTDARDTDFTAKLIDEYPPNDEFPEGFALNLSDSIVRARYRDYRDEPDFVTPGEIYEYRLDLYPTANVFKTRHRVRLDISASNYPRFDVNNNTGRELYTDRKHNVARNTVYHDSDHPTNVELPVVRSNER
jgi:putative CocE/NonD family hydrolase